MIRTLFFIAALLFLLVACSTQDASPTTMPTGTPVPLDQSFATPAVGAVTVLPIPGATSLALRSHPEMRAYALAVVEVGASGRLLGMDATGKWMLVKIDEKTGWVPTQYLDYTIPQ